MDGPAVGAMAHVAATAASRTPASLSSSAFNTCGSVVLTLRSSMSVRLVDVKACSHVRRSSSRTLQFLCLHPMDCLPRTSAGGVTPSSMRDTRRFLAASRTGALRSPRRSNTPGRNDGTCWRKRSGDPCTASDAHVNAPPHTLALFSFKSLDSPSARTPASSLSVTSLRSR